MMNNKNIKKERNLGSVGDVFELAVPVILALDHTSSVKLTAFKLHRHNVARGLME